MAETLRVVMVGCGGMAGAWLSVAKKVPCIDIVGLVDINEANAQKRKQDFELENAAVGTDMQAMLDKAGPDIVFDCTVPEAHVNVTLTALKHGCHVMGEKPLADSMENARKMVAAAQEAGKIYAVIQNRRYHPRIRQVRNFIESGALGDLTTINSDFYIGAHFGGFRDRMVHVLLLDMAIHTFDAARFIIGADAVAVYCHEWNPKGSWYDHDASAQAIFEMSNGAVYNYRGSWCAEGLNTSWECDWRMIGDQGGMKWNGGDELQAETVTETGGFKSTMAPAEIPEHHPEGKKDGHEGLIREFIRCVQTGGTPETACTDNIKSLAMVFGAIESAEKGKRVEIKVD